MSSKTLTLDSSTLFLNAHTSTSSQSTAPPPISFSLISDDSPLPPVPSDFPVSKLIPKTRFIVDGFRHAGDYSVSYFLSHFHSDHYTGLNPNWSKGIIFCSQTTARLVVEVLNVSSPFVVPLPLSQPVTIDGCEVSLVDANHCPGAVQFLFKIPCNDGKSERYVHTGDFRYCDSMKLDPILSEFVGAAGIFLDTTYCNPKFVFPSQEESIDHIVGVIEKMGVANDCTNTKSVLFLVATYVIGKEKILLEISRRCNTKIHVDSRKMSILSVLGLGEEGIFTEEESRTNVHVVGWNVLGETWPYFRPNFVKMKEIMDEKGYSKVVGFVPTGWTYEVKHNKFATRKKDAFEIHLVPYSEHSNYDELREYVRFLKPKRVIPTVGTDIEKLDSKHAVSMRKHFASLVDEMAVKQEFLMGFGRALQEGNDKVGKDSGTSKVGKDSGTSLSKRDELEIIHSPETKTSADFSPSLREDGLNELTFLGDKEKEGLAQQLSDCLPTWVTRNQILDLLRISDGNVVEAVSHFYEHETEFYEEICSSSGAPQKTSLLNQSESLSKPCFLDTPGLNICNPPAQKIIPSSAKVIVKSSASPGKRRRNVDNKLKKKARSNASSEGLDSKQSTITSFFKKPVPKASECTEIGKSPKECSKAKIIDVSDSAKLYKDELDQFIQIIDGSDSIRSYAASILEETKGDVNMALDRYYTNPGGNFGENTNSLEDSTRIIRAETSASDCYSQKKKVPPDVLGNLSVLPVAGLSPDAAAVDHVSLAPEKYSPVEHACWRQGVPTPYMHLARTFDLLENEKGKIRATSTLCNMFRSLLVLSPEDVLPAVYLCTNKIAPDHENKELSIGGSIVSAALEEACGTTRSKIKELYDSLGDLGDVAQLCRQTQSLLAPPPPLTIRGVFSSLHRISEQTGSGSNARKKSLIINLMRSCREKEMKFLVRTLVRNLRIGAMMRTVLPALSQAVVMNSNLHEGTIGSLKEKLQCLSIAIVEAYNILPNLDLLVPCLLEKGIEFSSAALSMVPGIPIKPMLAKISNGIPQVLKIFQNRALTCEFKYDGQRTQIHKLADGSVRVFSRNGDETTSKFPDIVNIIKESCSSASATFIVDAEVVAVDRKNGCKILSFQELASRERGSKDSLITVDRIKVEICLFLFDIMLADGEQLLNVPLRRRRKYLKDLFGDEKLGYLQYARETTVEATDACLDNETTLTRMQSFLDEAVSSSCEGLMVKSLDVDAGYSPSKRSEFWLKVKRDYVEGLGDSLDLVPIGAWHGNGRKAGWFSPFLMACYEPDTQEYQSVCRVMSGFSDSFYKEMKEFFSGERVISKKPIYYQTFEEPDMWFTPELVWEIRGADFTVSPVHKAAIGLVHPSRGISIRFPRFVRSVSDRNPDECSTAADVADMFNSQTRKADVSIKI